MNFKDTETSKICLNDKKDNNANQWDSSINQSNAFEWHDNIVTEPTDNMNRSDRWSRWSNASATFNWRNNNDTTIGWNVTKTSTTNSTIQCCISQFEYK